MKQQANETTVRVIRAFLMGGEPVPVDTVIVLETPFAMELVSMNKAVPTSEEPRSPRGSTENAGKKASKGKQRGGKAAEQPPFNDNQAPREGAEQQQE